MKYLMFRQKCTENGWWHWGDGATATHLLMSGGKLRVPLEDTPVFLDTYLQCLHQGEVISLVEKLGPRCMMRFFLDLDKPEGNAVREIQTFVQNRLQRPVSVCRCTESDNVHLICNAPMTAAEAQAIAQEIVQALPRSLTACIDHSVYNTGLRMVGSVKPRLKRVYLPESCKSIHDVDMDVLKSTIVRIHSIEMNNNAPCRPCTQCSELSPYLKKIDCVYGGVKITSTRRLGDTLIFGINSRYCANVGREHKSSNVYFVLDPKGKLYQKCFCKCTTATGRRFSYCSSYRSAPVNVPMSLISPMKASE